LHIKKSIYCISLCLFILVGRTHAQPGFNISIKGPETGAMRQDALGNFWVGIQGSAHYFNQFGEVLKHADTIPHNIYGFSKMQSVGNDMYSMTFAKRGLINLYKLDHKGHFTWITETLLSSEFGYKNPYFGQLGFYVDERYKQIILHGLYCLTGGLPGLGKKVKDCVWWRIIDYDGNTLYEDTFCTPELNTFAHHVLPHPQTGGYVLFCDKGNDFQFNTSEKAFLIGLDSNGKRVKVNDDLLPWMTTDEMGAVNNGNYFVLNNNIYFTTSDIVDNQLNTFLIPINENFMIDVVKKIEFDSCDLSNFLPISSDKILAYSRWSIKYFTIYHTDGSIYKRFDLPLPENTFITDLGIANDGGIYGCGWSTDKTTPWYFTAHIFKLDSNGNLNVGAKNPEIDMGLMLQPNPAQNQVYLRIPYDIGMVEATFYDMHGKKIMQSNQMSDMPINIQHLQNGLYIIKAKSLVNGVERTFKMEKI